MKRPLFIHIFVLFSLPVQAHFPEVPQDYEHLIRIISPVETQTYKAYNLYNAELISDEDELTRFSFILLLEKLLPNNGDHLTLKKLNLRRVSLSYKKGGRIVTSDPYCKQDFTLSQEEILMQSLGAKISVYKAYQGQAVLLNDEAS